MYSVLEKAMFLRDLWWNIFQKLPSIQYCFKFNTGDLSEVFDVEDSFEILSMAKEDVSVSMLADKEVNYQPQASRNFLFVFQFMSIKPL